MDTERELFLLVEEALDVKKGSISLEVTSADISEWDSLGHLAILSAISEKYGDSVGDNPKLASATSVREILELITSSDENCSD